MTPTQITVSQLNLYIRSLIESDDRLAFVRVSGEISNYKLHYSSGHIYFTLKDTNSAIKCVMFRSNAQRLKCELKDGMKVVCSGRVSVFERDGAYQLYAEDIIPDGEGDLMAALEKIKSKLDAEGLFEQSRKKSLPKFPNTVAVITSDTGAAVRDIFNVLSRRWPLSRVVLCPALVQGAEAPKSLIGALDEVIKKAGADVIIIGRGGGSIEDLWCFNDEKLARKIADCPIPVISAVGHETDFTICDFVADMRAPTPSAAAELAVPDIEEIKGSVAGYENLFKMRTRAIVSLCDARLSAINASVQFKRPTEFLTDSRADMIQKLKTRLQNSFEKSLSQKEKAFVYTAAKLDSLSPLKTMARGYLAADKEGVPLKSVQDVTVGDSLHLRFVDGSAECTVTDIKGE